MPRRGKGQKIQTAPGQTYGDAQQQEDAQRTIRLPELSDVAQGATMRPGQVPLNAPEGTPLPNVPEAEPSADALLELKERRARVASLLPALEAMASTPTASPQVRNTVRRMKMFVGNPADLVPKDD